MRLTVVGCSGSFPGPESPASSYLLQVDDTDGRTWNVVLDLGNGALGPLQAHVRLQDVDAVLLSHLHADHCLDLCGYYVALKYAPSGPRHGRIPVWGPKGTDRRMARAYDLNPSPGMSEEFDFRTLDDATHVDVGPLRILPRRVNHPVEAYGFRIEGPSTAQPGERRTLVYTGDTDSCLEVEELSQGADLLLSEAAFHEGRDFARGIHLTGRRAGELAAKADVKRLVLTHLPPWNDPALTIEEARSAFDGPIQLAQPGAVHVL
jgi:ribonuclease BN (tRNA processing enzyme)